MSLEKSDLLYGSQIFFCLKEVEILYFVGSLVGYHFVLVFKLPSVYSREFYFFYERTRF